LILYVLELFRYFQNNTKHRSLLRKGFIISLID
jgi:hypothetical protein